MIIHFTLKSNSLTVTYSKYRTDLSKLCKDKRGKYFILPSNIKSPVALEYSSHVKENTTTEI